ncbi:MAG: hypothetical protein JSR45_03400 [Proteobacteria bacterium]|nr:hypothetical protein [Pseudomonadota bacterium]
MTDRPNPKTRPPNAPPPPAPLLDAIVAAETSEHFIEPAKDCFRLIGRAVLVLLAGALALDLAAGLARVGGVSLPLSSLTPLGWGAGAAALVGFAAVVTATSMLGSIQVRWIFEHAHLHKGHFYALKLARQREATAALHSLDPAVAVPAVAALIDLRRETGMLDRQLAIETLMLGRRWRDLTWFPRAGAAAGIAGACAWVALAGPLDTYRLAAPVGLLTLSLVAWIAVGLWAGERVARVREVLATMPPDLSREFDPSPHLKATVERLLVRINHHFDRLKGVQTQAPDTVEEEAA